MILIRRLRSEIQICSNLASMLCPFCTHAAMRGSEGSNHRTGDSKFRPREFDFCAWIGRRANASSFTLDNTATNIARGLACGESLEPAYPVTKQLRGSRSRCRQGGLPSFPHPFGVRINRLLTILRRFPGVSIDLRVQGSVIAIK